MPSSAFFFFVDVKLATNGERQAAIFLCDEKIPCAKQFMIAVPSSTLTANYGAMPGHILVN